MNRIKALSFLPILFLVAISISSCSGPKAGTVCVACVGTGNAVVSVTVTSTPSQTFFFPSLQWEISSVQLVNTSSTTTVVQGALPPVDFARLQTDSQFLGTASSVPAGTYTSATIHLAPSTAFSYFLNSSNAALFGCAVGAVCQIPNTVPGFGAATVTVPVSFTVTANNNAGFSLKFDLSKAVTTAAGMTFDFTQSGAITLSALPRLGQSSGLDSLENFTGTVTATTSTSFSMSSLSSDTRTFTLAATGVEFDDPFTVCAAPASFSCLAINQNVSVDAVVNSDGTLTAYEVDFLDPVPFVNEVEGVIVTPLANNQFQMVVTNGMGITGFLPGTLATVNVNAASSYFVDPKNLGVSTTPLGFQDSTDLVVGQTVMLKGGSANFSNNSFSNYTRTLLRYSSIGGTIQSPSGTIFTLSGVNPFFTNLAANSVEAQTFTNTTYDNITGGFSGLVTGTNASVRGLYLNPNKGETQPLLAAQVRTH